MSGKGARRSLIAMQLVLGSIYIAMVMLPLAAAMASPAWRSGDAYGKLTSALVLIVFSLLALQPVLAARFKPLDRAFGLDMVYVFHKTMGMSAALLQLCALAFFLAGPGLPVPAAVWVASALICALGATALLYRELGMTYEAWRTLHNALFAGVFLAGFLQTWDVTRGMSSTLLRGTVVLLAIAAIAAYLHHKVLGPAARQRVLYRVKSVVAEARNVWTLTFEPPENKERFAFLPGQFQFITFDRGTGEEHPFTIASSPRDARLHSSTIKASGDFTKSIGTVRAGDLVGIQAAFGRFSPVLEPGERRLAFIAGGIGITPFMSMLRYMRDIGEEREIVLFYANRSEEDIVFRRELDALSASAAPRLRVVHVLDAANDAWQGERGRIDRPLIEKYTGDLGPWLYYLCGPPPMMNALVAMLINAGVPAKRVRTERFEL